MKRWDDILFNCSFRLLQLLLSFSIYGYKQINSEINETFIKTPLSVTPEDMEVIQRRLSDIQRIEKQNFKAKQNKKFKRDHLNQQSSVLEEDQILNMLKESKSKQPRKRRFKKQKNSVQDNLVVNLSSIELTDSEEKLLTEIQGTEQHVTIGQQYLFVSNRGLQHRARCTRHKTCNSFLVPSTMLEKEYINVIFGINDELEHGKRYIVCIHAPRKEVEYEKWTEVLKETNTCSDGVTVDLTPPTPGSTKGGTDIFPFTSVGLVNHYTTHKVPLHDGLLNKEHYGYRTVTSTTLQSKSVGSHPGHDDIIPFTKTMLDCGVSAEDKTINIHEGHAYFITVKAINRANLISTASSWAYIYDMSPPVAGHAYDGSRESAASYMKDIDYQTDVKTLSAYWEGFHDLHSTIKAYYVSIGTCPECEDVLVNQDIGISNNFNLCHMHLGSGIQYYTTITACYTADMCTSVTTDGVVIDNSPPTQGIVLDGVDVYDIEYQSLRNYISAKWYGFTDPQSSIDRFPWRVGTKPGSDDIVKSTHLPRSDVLVEPDLLHKLPQGQRIYVTIKAYNKAGLSTEAHSNGFYIDDTPPLMKVKPYVSAELGSIKDNSLVFRSTIRIHWELNGIVREYTFSEIDLHDGGIYTVKLIVCNGAKICVEDESKGIVIDSSPPTPGMFAIKTDHAANLHRHVDGWMTWSRYKLRLSWLGFTDLHTEIDKYFVSLGSKYMTDDFNKISGSPQEFLHNQSGVDKYDEGYVQTFEVDTKHLAKFEHVFVSVWAVNQNGLPSRMIHSQFKLVPVVLELIRRCSAVTCHGHCVCAAQGQRCSKRSCNDVTKANNNNLLGIYDITNIQESSPFSDVKYTPSNVALAAKWLVVQAQGLRPLWYEWTAGYSDKDEPEGVFDNLNDDVWHHAGQTNQAVLNIRRGQRLKESPVSYSMFVRVWYNDDTFADFKTDGILAMSTPLPRRKKKEQRFIVEQLPGHWKKDIDYIKPGAPFTIRWTNVFKDDANIIDKFKLYLSTYPGGHDIHEVELDLPGSTTSHNISRVPLSPGKVFYSNAVGYSYSGIHAAETSDGIMVDSQPPVTGTVYDGIGDEIESLVYAMDVIGHQSLTVKSNGIMIDSTHPEPTLMEHLDHNEAENPSFEETDGPPIDWDNITNINLCNTIVSASQWNNSIWSCVSVLKSDKNLALDGRSSVFVEGQISQTLSNLKAGHLFCVTFVTAHPPILGAVLANKEGYVEIGDKRHVFMVYTKA
ncbi:unnamed protein product [Mytilus coruscus]|uniref:Uncharacterized protein n=1 Tax=Mytilus coruscus TaxID=42192 RepID=A0A6J8DEG5_MYTCO|nr:unnamed protein product [Mytilus coruscus]